MITLALHDILIFLKKEIWKNWKTKSKLYKINAFVSLYSFAKCRIYLKKNLKERYNQCINSIAFQIPMIIWLKFYKNNRMPFLSLNQPTGWCKIPEKNKRTTCLNTFSHAVYYLWISFQHKHKRSKIMIAIVFILT